MTGRLQIGALIFAVAAALVAGVLLSGGTAFGRYGDADCDATVSTVDAAMVLYYEAHLQELPCSENADLNGDLRVDSKDAAMILQYVAGLWSTNLLSNSHCPPQGCPTSTPCPPGGCPTRAPTRTPTPEPTWTPCPQSICPPATPVGTPYDRSLPRAAGGITDVTFSLAIDADGDALDDCSTRDDIPTACSLQFGDVFTVKVSLDSLPPALDGYAGFETILTHEGVTSKNNPRARSWPDCAFDVAHAYQTWLVVGCTINVAPAPLSTYTGVIGAADFHCTASGTVSLAHGGGRTDIVDSGLNDHVEATDGFETLTINCG